MLSDRLNAHRRRLVAGAALAVLTAQPALAQQPAAPPAEPERNPEITVYANRVPTSLPRVGAAVTVITGEELREQGTPTVADALRTVPGVSVAQSGTRGTLTQVRIRGGEANHTLVLIDGVPANGVDTGDFNFADLPVDDIERIEIIRGPQSGLYGANAHTGVIAIVTKSGRGLTTPQMDARLEGGTQNSHAAHVGVRGAAGPVHGAISATRTGTDGFNISRFGSETDGARAFTLSARGGIELAPNVSVDGSLRHVRRFAESDPEDYVNFGGPTYGLVVNGPDNLRYQTFSGRLGVTWSLFDGAFTQTLAGSRFDEQSRFRDLTGSYDYNGTRDTIDYRGALRFETGAVRHTVALGAALTEERFSQFSSFFDPATTPVWGRGFERQERSYSGEWLVDLPFGLSVAAALRHDDFTGFQDATTWRVTAAQRFEATGTRLHASVGTGITKPTFIEQFGFFPGNFIGNPGLVPEHSFGFDVGVEQSFFSGRLVIDVTWFNSRLEDEIVTRFLPSFETTVENADGTSTREGVEVTLTAQLLPWLTAKGSYTYTDSQTENRPEIRRPRHAAAASLTATFDEGRGRFSVTGTWNGARPDEFFGTFPASRVRLAPYTLVGAQLSYDVRPDTTLYARAENLFGSRHEDVFSYRAPGFAAYAGIRVRLGQDPR